MCVAKTTYLDRPASPDANGRDAAHRQGGRKCDWRTRTADTTPSAADAAPVDRLQDSAAVAAVAAVAADLTPAVPDTAANAAAAAPVAAVAVAVATDAAAAVELPAAPDAAVAAAATIVGAFQSTGTTAVAAAAAVAGTSNFAPETHKRFGALADTVCCPYLPPLPSRVVKELRLKGDSCQPGRMRSRSAQYTVGNSKTALMHHGMALMEQMDKQSLLSTLLTYGAVDAGRQGQGVRSGRSRLQTVRSDRRTTALNFLKARRRT